ncbi:overexpressed in colon carcinoma 1 protein isoform X1 [Ranitomeya imitator]|uniref:overexpressed in colon carcinoma 1 protein isoform X1 n=1 Tax=Ranitomeya imitator TaxID=111125 RepID=UPI0037E74EA5
MRWQGQKKCSSMEKCPLLLSSPLLKWDISIRWSGNVTSQDDKHRNYGGVYVGLPTDTTTTYRDPKGAEAASQSKERSTTPGSPLPENVC